MSTFASIGTIVLVLATIFVPQALAVYFSERGESADETYVPDGR
jgi:hypothetical protein